MTEWKPAEMNTANFNSAEYSLRRVRTNEATLYKDLRLGALQEAPEAFCTQYAEAAARDEESWSAQADENATSNDRALFLAFADNAPIGLAGIYRSEQDEHLGELCQVWVAPTYRGSGVAVALIDAVCAWASERDFTTILATIRAGNDRAVRFYRKYGFTDAADETGPLPGDVVLARAVARDVIGSADEQ